MLDDDGLAAVFLEVQSFLYFAKSRGTCIRIPGDNK